MTIMKDANCNIFNALHEAMTAKDKNRLKFVKCQECGRLTPYRLKILKGKTLHCKKCSKPIMLSSFQQN